MKRNTSSPITSLAKKTQAAAVAACVFEVSSGSEIQLLPAGEFRATDGRPFDAPFWYVDAEIAADLIAQLDGRENPLVIDYEHQSLLASENGKPAPASGWFKKLEWREGSGLWAVDVVWTEAAKAMIDAKEYLYISPVFSYSKKTGAVNRLINAALTNNPALDGMSEVVLMAASTLLSDQPDQSKQEKLTMDLDTLLADLRWMLNLPTLATAEEVMAEVQKALAAIKAAAPAETAAANFSIVNLLQHRDHQIATLKSAEPDPKKYVSVETMTAVQDELTALRTKVNTEKVDSLVTAALSDGRLLPAQEEWARKMGGKDVADLESYLSTATPIASLTNTQTGGKPPAKTQVDGELTESQLAICKQMGVSPEDYKKTLAASE